MCGILCLVQYGLQKLNITKAIECLDKLGPRGPDKKSYSYHKISDSIDIFMGFCRLSIMDTTDAGQQPFSLDNSHVICNGEIYNWEFLALKYGINLKSNCDCEIILPLYKKKTTFYSIVSEELDAEFAMVLLDIKKNIIYAARDRYGVRPLFYGYNKSTKTVGFASELKALHQIMEFVEPVKPNQIISLDLGTNPENIIHSFNFIPYYSYQSLVAENNMNNICMIQENINYYLTIAVAKRLCSDRKIGFLLSGGLDSSLIVSIASKILGPENIVCFSIGMENSPDIVAAKKVAKFLGIREHYIVPFDIQTAIKIVPDVIRTIESFDVTTIRASTPQHMLAKYIKENTDIRVLLSGEGSDEEHGSYRYFRNAPNITEFHQETLRLLQELYMFDNLRTDRTMAAFGLEVRVPFLDFAYVKFIKSINVELLMYTPDRIEKKIIRDSFKKYLPDEILYRPKEAFSDAVNTKENNWFKMLQERLEKEIGNDELENNEFLVNKPEMKEALYYRRIFNEIYPGRDNIIRHYWLPRWQKEKVVDPSATILKCY